MLRKKKITVKYVPRKAGNLKGDFYLIYLRITFNRKSTNVSTGIAIEGKSKDEIVQALENENIKFESNDFNLIMHKGQDSVMLVKDTQIYSEEKRLTFLRIIAAKKSMYLRLVEKELELVGEDNYSIVGINDRIFHIYKRNLASFLGSIFRHNFLLKLEDVLTYRKYMDFVGFLNMFKEHEFGSFFNTDMVVGYVEEILKLSFNDYMSDKMCQIIVAIGLFTKYSFEVHSDLYELNRIEEFDDSQIKFFEEKKYTCPYNIDEWIIDLNIPHVKENALRMKGIKSGYIDYLSIYDLEKIKMDFSEPSSLKVLPIIEKMNFKFNALPQLINTIVKDRITRLIKNDFSYYSL